MQEETHNADPDLRLDLPREIAFQLPQGQRVAGVVKRWGSTGKRQGASSDLDLGPEH